MNYQKKQKFLVFAALLATSCAVSSCSEGEKYSKEPESETILEVNQPPYKFRMLPKHEPDSKVSMQVSIDRNGSPVDDAVLSATLIEHDGTEHPTEFHKDEAAHAFVGAATLKHHEDYLLKTEITVDGKTLGPIFTFHNDDPALEKLDPSKLPSEKTNKKH